MSTEITWKCAKKVYTGSFETARLGTFTFVIKKSPCGVYFKATFGNTVLPTKSTLAEAKAACGDYLVNLGFS